MNSDRCRGRPEARFSGSSDKPEGEDSAVTRHEKDENLLEALENFAEALAILYEWDEGEQRETRDDDENGDPTGA